MTLQLTFSCSLGKKLFSYANITSVMCLAFVNYFWSSCNLFKASICLIWQKWLKQSLTKLDDIHCLMKVRAATVRRGKEKISREQQ